MEKIIPTEVTRHLRTNGTCHTLSSDELQKVQVDWLNETSGNLEGDDCPICKNRGFVMHLKDGIRTSVECECMVKRRSLKRIKRSGLGDLLEKYTFENFQTDTPWQADMKEKAQRFVADHGGKWFAAMGTVGSGKSHICTAICKELIAAGHEVRYMLWRDISRQLKADVNNNDAYLPIIEPLKRVKVLYIDDLFKTRQGGEIKDADVNLAFEILNARYCNRKLVTIISSEKSIEEILEIDEAVGSRIFERSKEYHVRLTGNKNRRLA